MKTYKITKALVAAGGLFVAPAFALEMTVNTTEDLVWNTKQGVDCTDTSARCSLRAAIQIANSNPGQDTIRLDGGTYTLTIPTTGEDNALDGDLDIAEAVVITALDPANTPVIDGNNTDRIFDIANFKGDTSDAFEGKVSISNVKLQNGWYQSTSYGPSSGGCLKTKSQTLYMNNVVFENCSAKGSGGAIYLTDATAKIENSTFDNNSTNGTSVYNVGGAIYVNNSSSLNISNSNFKNNSSKMGGAIYASLNGLLQVSNSRFENNGTDTSLSAFKGGAIYTEGKSHISNSKLNNNDASYGGAIYSALNSLTLKSSELDGNSADSGGAIYVSRSVYHIIDTDLAGNSSQCQGGAAYIEFSTGLNIITGSNFSNNMTVDTCSSYYSAPDGGALYIYSGDSYLTNSHFENNKSSEGDGGGLHLANGTFNLSNVTIKSNQAKLNGGAISAYKSDLHISSSAISNNQSGLLGGALFIDDENTYNPKEYSLENTSFIDNTSAKGGAIALGIANLAINNATLHGNSASEGGSQLYSPDLSSEVAVSNTIISKGLITNDCSVGNPGNKGGNVLTDNSCRDYGTVITDAGLLDATNGFMPLAGNSGAIDAGNGLNPGDDSLTACSSEDQRGNSRDAGNCDAGAFEFNGSANTTKLVLEQNVLSISEGGKVDINVKREGDGDGSIEFLLVSSADSTASSSDISVTNTLSWDAGNNESKPLTVTTKKDSIDETLETAKYELYPLYGFNSGGTSSLTVDISQPSVGKVQFAKTRYRQDECDCNVQLEVQRIDGTLGTLIVNYAISAQSGDNAGTGDFRSTSGNIRFYDGEVGPKTISARIYDDADIESAEESFSVKLTADKPEYLVTDKSQAKVLIVDNDGDISRLSFSRNNYDVNEAEGKVAVMVQQDKASAETVTVQYRTRNDSAISGQDYAETLGTLRFNPGETSKTINIPVVSYQLGEAQERFRIELFNPGSNATIDGDSATITILAHANNSGTGPDGDSGSGSGNDSDGGNGNTDGDNGTDNAGTYASIALAESTYNVFENDNSVNIVLMRSGDLDKQSSVVLRTRNGTATDGEDYDNMTTEVFFAVGETTKTVTITLIDDQSTEGPEQLFIDISEPSDGTRLELATANINIADNETPAASLSNDLADSIDQAVGGGGGGSMNWLLLAITLLLNLKRKK